MRDVSRRDFIRGTTIGGAALASGCAGLGRRQRAERPNVLLIVDDQHSPRAMSWTGQTQVITPHLDQLASESVRFSNGYCNSPVCAPTRHTLYTGLYPSEHGVLHNDLPMHDVPTVTSLLNQAGYTTACIGKMHNAPYHHRRDFQYVLHHEFYLDAAGISHYAPYLAHSLKRRGIQPKPWSTPRSGRQTWLQHVDTIAFTMDRLPEDLTAERWTTDESLRFIRDQLRERPGQPFFLHASYFPPHHPYGPIPKYARMYDPDEMTLPPNYDREKLAAWCRGASTPDPMTDDNDRWMRAHYFAFCTQLDAEIGRLLDGLDGLGVAENTIVIFISDHGDLIGEHGMFYKGVMYDGSARVPFMIRWPGVSRPREVEAPVMHADLVPTILGAVGIEIPGHLPGRDLQPLLVRDNRWPDRPVYSEYFSRAASHFMIRQGPFKLIATAPYGRWEEFLYQLYNVDEDPWELNDLVSRTENRPTFARLSECLSSIWARQREFLPPEIPKVMPRSRYRIPWPANPWEPVYPV